MASTVNELIQTLMFGQGLGRLTDELLLSLYVGL